MTTKNLNALPTINLNFQGLDLQFQVDYERSIEHGGYGYPDALLIENVYIYHNGKSIEAGDLLEAAVTAAVEKYEMDRY